MFVEINAAVGYGGLGEATAVFDTHSYGRHIRFNGCVAYGGGPICAGFQMRAQYIEMNNCKAYNCARQGVDLAASSKNVSIIGGEFAHNNSVGIQVDGSDHHITGVSIHDNARAGIGYFYSTCINLLVDNCEVRENKYGLHDGGATAGSVNTTIHACTVPKGTVQAISILNASATTLAENCAFTGYGPGSDGTVGAEPGSRFIEIVTDAD